MSGLEGIPRERIEAAASLGHRGARALCPGVGQLGPEPAAWMGAIDLLAPFECATFAADCAEHVLWVFERRRPKDERPRAAILAARSWAKSMVAVTAETIEAARAAMIDADLADFDPAAAASASAAQEALAATVCDQPSWAAGRCAIFAQSAVNRADYRGAERMEDESAWQMARLAALLLEVKIS